MRIVVVSNLYPSPAHPAFGTFVRARVDALRDAGATVDVVAIRDPSVGRRLVAKYGRLAIGAARLALAERRRGHVDIVEAHIAYPTGLIARPLSAVLGARLVLFAHGADVLVVSARSSLHRRLSRATLAAASLVVANSEYLATEVRTRFPKAADRVVVRSPGIELDRFLGRDRGPNGRAGVLFVGRLVEGKGVGVLLEAMAGLPANDRPALTIVGDGPERVSLERDARTLGVEAAFRGDLDRAEVAAAMQRAAVVAVPSVSAEALGLVALEAMAAGAIVVASASGGLGETVHDGVDGLLVPPGDADALRDALRRGLSLSVDPAGAAIRARALDVARAHDVAAIARASLAEYDGLAR